MWGSLGFRESPYNTAPLMARKEDVELLVGRETEAIQFCTNLDTSRQGILILSGAPGVGKTSFFNVQQYLLENKLSPFGPYALAARKLCPVQPSDDARKIAIRALDSLHKSIEGWCGLKGQMIPQQAKLIGKWLSGASTGFEFGIQILGSGGSIGRSVNLPEINDASFEAIVDAAHALVAEAVETLGFESVIVALDNLENLKEEQLKALLISFRDTLFSIPNLWWVLIGQSGLGSMVQSIDPRVFERVTGSGIEIQPIELSELNSAIAARVKKFHKSGNGAAPLTLTTHKMLFEASYGEMRFVFKYSNSICTKFVENIRSVIASTGMDLVNRSMVVSAIDKAIGERMINNQIDHELCERFLKEIVSSEIKGLALKEKEKNVLRLIGEKSSARPSEFKDFGFKTMQDFSSNYLTKLYGQNLLVREQEGKAVNYRLRGVARLADTYGLFDKDNSKDQKPGR